MASRGRRGRRVALGLVGALLLGGAPGLQAQDSGSARSEVGGELPRVLILTTGGTIASTPGDMLSGEALVGAVPELGDYARLTVEEVFRIGSSSMTPDHWLRLGRRILAARAEDPGWAGIVVTHGTDTMEETSYFLDRVLPPGPPVVLTGSMRPAGSLSADGPRNLVDAVRVATSPTAVGQGVLVVLNERIHAGADVRKTHDESVETFRSSEWGALGRVHADTVRLDRTVASPDGPRAVFDLEGLSSLPGVALVPDYAGASGTAVEEAAAGARGVVVETFAGGRMSPGVRAAVQRVAAQGSPVVLASREEEGRIPTGAGEPDGESLVLVSPGLPAHKARILLMLALTRTDDPVELRRILVRD